MKIKPKIKFKLILILVLIFLFAFPLTASAQTVTSQMSSVLSGLLGNFAQFLTVLLKVLQRILWPIFLAIGGLLNNDILFGYGMEQRLLEVWVQMRNYVNIAFVLVLLGVALFNVLAFKPDSEFALKTFLPKFVIALVAVNFSYIAMKIVLDVTNVATTAVFTLPSSISEDVASPQIVKCTDGNYKNCTIANEKVVEKICTSYYGSVEEFQKSAIALNKLDKKQKEAIQQSVLCKVENNKLTLSDNGKKFFSRYNSRNAGLVIAIQFMNVIDVDSISTATDKGLSSLTFNLLFSVILYLVYGAAYLAIFVVLLTRLVALWLFIVLSPFIALTFVVPNLIPESGKSVKDSFIKNAFAPILMGIPLTLGYIILEAFRHAQTSNEVGLGTAFNMVKLETSGISDLQSMIIAFAAVAIVWVGVFAAANGTIAQTAVEGIKGKLRGLGLAGVKALKLLPVVPAGEGGKGISYAQALAKARKPWEEFQRKHGVLPEKTISTEEIRRITKKGSVEEGKKAILASFGTPGKERLAYQMLQKWKGRTGSKQQKFARGVLEGLTEKQRKEFAKGKLSSGARRALETNRFMRGVAPSTSKPRRPGATPPSTKPAPGAAGTTAKSGIGGDLQTIGSAAGYGVAISPGLSAARTKWTNAVSSGDKKAQKEAEDEIQTKYKDEVGRLKQIDRSGGEIGVVQTSAGEIRDVNNPAKSAVDDLKKKLERADKSLKKNHVGDADRKRILGQVLQKATGNKAADLVKKAPDIGKYVTVQ